LKRYDKLEFAKSGDVEISMILTGLSRGPMPRHRRIKFQQFERLILEKQKFKMQAAVNPLGLKDI
jgi:hypothetical protein